MSFIAAVATAVLLPGFTTLANGPSGGRVLSGVFPGAARAGDVYLPPGFTTTARYPVVYLLHGMPGSPSEYIQGTDLLDWADGAIASGTVPPFIAILPAAGTRPQYNGEWAGPWEHMVVDRIVPWVDRHLPTIASARGRTIAGLSAGGFGAFDIGLHHPQLFGTIESWSGYFAPLHDGPFRDASGATLEANDPELLVRSEVRILAHDHTRFFLSTGPNHSHWFTSSETTAFARELHALGLRAGELTVRDRKGEWREQMQAGLTYALAT